MTADETTGCQVWKDGDDEPCFAGTYGECVQWAYTRPDAHELVIVDDKGQPITDIPPWPRPVIGPPEEVRHVLRDDVDFGDPTLLDVLQGPQLNGARWPELERVRVERTPVLVLLCRTCGKEDAFLMGRCSHCAGVKSRKDLGFHS